MKRIACLILIIFVSVFSIFCAKKTSQIKEEPKSRITYERSEVKKPAVIEMRFVTQAEEGQVYSARETNEFLYLGGTLLLGESDVASAAVVTDEYGNAGVQVQLNEKASERFAKITEDNNGRRIGIVVNGELITAPKIMNTITDGKIVIKGSLTKIEAETIAKSLTK